MARDSDDGLTKATRSPLLRKLLGWLASAIGLWMLAWIKGWEEGLARAPDIEGVKLRVVALETFAGDAGLEIELLNGESAATRKLLDEESLAASQEDIDVHRDIVLSNVAASRALASVREYDRLIGKGVKPHDAMDIVLGWSRPPGR